MILLGIDPGGTIGTAFCSNGKLLRGYEFDDIKAVICMIRNEMPDRVILEDYILSSGSPGINKFGKMAVKQIGVIEFVCWEEDIPLIIQSPSSLFYSLKKAAGAHKSPHVTSAYAHVLMWVSNNLDKI